MTQDPLSSDQIATPLTDAAVWYAEHDSMPTIPVVDADFARAQERQIAELVQLCRTMLGDEDGEAGKPTWHSIYAIEEKLKEWGYLS